MNTFKADQITDQTATTSKGLVISLGDIVVTKGSKTLRLVTGISQTSNSDHVEVHAKRCDENGDLLSSMVPAFMAWMDPEKLKIVGSVFN